MNTTVAHLAAFLPRDRAEQIRSGAPLAAEGVAVIADISGFTPLTEALARELSPARGAEELTRALNGVFAPLIDEVHRYGGSVIKFAGDALIVWFPRPPRARRDLAVLRALAAAAGMQAAIARHGQVQTPAGPFSLTMKVGMAYGPVLRVRLGDRTLGYEDVIGGATLDRMAEAEHHAEPGEILLDPAGIAEAERLARVCDRRDGLLLVAGPARPVAAARRPPPRSAAAGEELEQALRPYLPAEVSEAILAGRTQPAELKPVVSIFVQFQGIVYEEGPAAEARLAGYFAAAQATAARYGGRVNRLLTGDKGSVLHLIFGAPRAVEELERRAALCLLELRRAAAELGFISAQRIGAAAGRVFAGPVGSDERRDYTVMGDTINLSARLMQGAEAGQIVIDAALAGRLAGEFALEDLGEARLKGKAAPVARHALLGQAARAPRRAARAYGRGLELATLRRQVERLSGGRGGIAVLIGDLGMGKSHLLAALRESSVLPSPPLPPSPLQGEGGAISGSRGSTPLPRTGGGAGGGGHALTILWAGAAAAGYGQPRSGALIANALRELFDLGQAGDPAARLGAALAELLGERAGAAAFPYLARFMGLPLDEVRSRELAALAGESLRWRVFELLGEIVRASCARRPLVLALDDLQWADPTSLELTEALLPLANELPLLLILASRPGGRIPVARGRGPDPGALRIELGRLDEAAALAVVTQHAPSLSRAARARLAERGQGNPLFLVELARTAAQGGDPDELPDSVQGLLLAQIDRLPGELRETLQLAAVLGPSFAPRLLAALAGAGAPLDARLEALEAAGFLLRAGEGYGFRHILIRESAYGAMLYERRRGHHGAAAAAIERLYPTRLAERSGELAEHYERAEQLDTAARYHGQAADGARLLYANEEAEAGYRHVLELLEKGSGDEGLRARTYLKLAQVRMNAGDYTAAQELYDVAFELLEREEERRPARENRRIPVFRMGIDEPETLDPGLCEASASEEIISNLFEGLVDLDEDLNVVPAAARRWRIEDNGQRYIFELRPNLRWSDGASVTAHDFVFAWRRNLHPDTKAGLAQLLYVVRGAQAFHERASTNVDHIGLRALDRYTFSIDLETVRGFFLYLLALPIAFPQPEHVVTRHGSVWASPEHIVSNGPFQLRGASANGDIDLTRSPYFDRATTGDLTRVHLLVGGNSQQNYRRHTIDWVQLDRAVVEEQDTRKENVITQQRLATFFLAFSLHKPPFSSQSARQAFATSINRHELVERVTSGIQRAATGGMVPPGMPGHSADIGPHYTPAGAHALLQQSIKSGLFPSEVRIAGLPDSQTPHYLAESWRQSLGIKVLLAENVPIEEMVEGLQRNTFHMALLAWQAEYPDPDSMLRVLFHSESPLNCFGWRNKAYDHLVEQAAASLDQRERLALYHAAEHMLVAEETVIFPLFYYQSLGILRAPFRFQNQKTFIRGNRLRLDRILTYQDGV